MSGVSVARRSAEAARPPGDENGVTFAVDSTRDTLNALDALLALCIPGSTGEASTAPVQAGSPPSADWDALIQHAILQGVAPLVAVRSRALAIPTAVRERLESLYRANAMRNLRLAAEEARLCSALNSAGLRHWTLKGPGLSERLYGDIGVRQISDLDLLIEPASLARADALLASLGFRRQTAGGIASLAAAQELIYIREAAILSSSSRSNGDPSFPAQRAIHSASGAANATGDFAQTRPPSPSFVYLSEAAEARDRARGVPPFFSAPASQSSLPTRHSPPPTAVYLDLHQRLLPYVRRDALAARVFREGMTSDNLLLYLCANQITHRFARLRYLCDVSAFLDREGGALDWDRFLRSARALPWGPGIGLCLRWASQVSRVPAPDEVLRELRPNPIGGLLLRRALGASPAEAATRTRILDSSAGAAIPLAAAYLGRPSACGIAWNLLLPSRAYLREQTGAPAGHPLAAAYATRLMHKIPAALRQLLKPAP